MALQASPPLPVSSSCAGGGEGEDPKGCKSSGAVLLKERARPASPSPPGVSSCGEGGVRTVRGSTYSETTASSGAKGECTALAALGRGSRKSGRRVTGANVEEPSGAARSGC